MDCLLYELKFEENKNNCLNDFCLFEKYFNQLSENANIEYEVFIEKFSFFCRLIEILEKNSVLLSKNEKEIVYENTKNCSDLIIKICRNIEVSQSQNLKEDSDLIAELLIKNSESAGNIYFK